MDSDKNTDNFRAPSRKSLITSTVIAAVTAVIILVTVILPAEYSIDPTGLGKLLRLTELSQAAPSGNSATNIISRPVNQVSQEVADTKTSGNHKVPYHTDVIEIVMAPEDELEYKATLEQGEPLLYSWQTDNQEHLVYYDFHGEPVKNNDRYPEDYFMSYEEKQEGASSSHGYLIAPFTGNHGWYLLNFNDYPVTVRLTISGNYSWHGYVGRWNNYAQAGGE